MSLFALSLCVMTADGQVHKRVAEDDDRPLIGIYDDPRTHPDGMPQPVTAAHFASRGITSVYFSVDLPYGPSMPYILVNLHRRQILMRLPTDMVQWHTLDTNNNAHCTNIMSQNGLVVPGLIWALGDMFPMGMLPLDASYILSPDVRMKLCEDQEFVFGAE